MSLQIDQATQKATLSREFDRGSLEARSRTIGLWSAFAFTLFVVALAVTETVDMINHISLDFLSVGIGLFIPPAFVVMLAALHDCVPSTRRIWSLLGLMLASMWATVSLSAYFLQLTVVRYGLAHGQTEGLSILTFANQYSVGWALDFLGWGLFFGLATLVTAAVFGKTRTGRVARWLFALNSVSMFALLIGYVVPWPMVEQAGALVGYFIAQPAAGLVMALIFRRGRRVDFA